MRLKVTPTALKHWFQYRCERQLVYDTMRRQPGAPQIRIRQQGVGSLWIDEGVAYEARVIAELERARGPIRKPGFGDDDRLSTAASWRFIRREDPHLLAHQLSLSSTPALRRRLRLPAEVDISSGLVDVLEVKPGDQPSFRIADVKATQVATLFHKTQVALYALMLEAMLEQYQLPGFVDPEAEIWHRMDEGESLWNVAPFDVRAYVHVVEDFFHQRGAEFANYDVGPDGSDQAPFHVYFKCEQCKFLTHCEAAFSEELAPAQLDLSAIAGMSQQSKKTLHHKGIATVGDLVDNANRLGTVESWALRSRGWILVQRARSLLERRILRFEGQYSLQMPPVIDRPIYLLADHDPIDGRLATLGCLVIDDEGLERYAIHVVEDLDQEAAALIDVLSLVVSTLADIDAWNAKHARDNPLHTHIFTYEPSEAADLQSAIGRHLEREPIRQGLLQMIRIFPPEQVVPEPDYHGFHHLPASSLRNVVTDLFALPVRVSHDLARVSRALAEAGEELTALYEPEPLFARAFSSRLSIDVCRRRSEPQLARAIVADVRQRLMTMHALTQWLHERDAQLEPRARILRLNKRPFRFRHHFDPLGAADLDVLQAQSLLNSRSALLSALIGLARPAAQRRDRLNCYASLRLVDHAKKRDGSLRLLFHVPKASRMAELSTSDMDLILTDGNPDLLLSPDSWQGLRASLLPASEHTHANQIEVKIWPRTARLGSIEELIETNADGPWFLDKAHIDLNTGKIVEFLRFLAGGAARAS